jgi:hypothetical protein
MNTVSQWAMRVGIGATLAVSGVIHAYLYIHGYKITSPRLGRRSFCRPACFVRSRCWS